MKEVQIFKPIIGKEKSWKESIFIENIMINELSPWIIKIVGFHEKCHAKNGDHVSQTFSWKLYDKKMAMDCGKCNAENNDKSIMDIFRTHVYILV